MVEIIGIVLNLVFFVSWFMIWSNWRKELKRRHKLELEVMRLRQQLLEQKQG